MLGDEVTNRVQIMRDLVGRHAPHDRQSRFYRVALRLLWGRGFICADHLGHRRRRRGGVGVAPTDATARARCDGRPGWLS